LNLIPLGNFIQDLTTVTCPGNTQGYFLHPFDCTKYINCRNQQTLIESCERGKVFSISQRHCVAREHLESTYDRVDYLTERKDQFTYNYREYEGRNVYSDDKNADVGVLCPRDVYGLYAHPFDARSYFYCVAGESLIKLCPSTDLFSISRGYCTKAELVPETDRVSRIVVAEQLSCECDKKA